MSGFPFLKNFRGLRVKRTTEDLEFQEVFLDKLVADEEAAVDLYGERKLEIPLSRYFLWGLYAAFLLIVFVFFIRTFHLQVFAGEELQKQAEENAIRSQPLDSDRGVMYDRFMKQLVFNRPSFDLVCDKLEISQQKDAREVMFQKLERVSDFSAKELESIFNKQSSSTMLIGENLSHEELIIVETKLENLKGCWVQENTIREYVEGSGLSHLLGYTAKVTLKELEEFS